MNMKRVYRQEVTSFNLDGKVLSICRIEATDEKAVELARWLMEQSEIVYKVVVHRYDTEKREHGAKVVVHEETRWLLL